MEGSNSGGAEAEGGSGDAHHGGGDGPTATIKINVSHGPSQFDLNVPAYSTFGDVKGLIFQETGLEPKDQRLLFRGKEKEDQDHLHEAGLKNNSKLLLMKNTTSKESVLKEVNGGCELSKGSVAIAQVKEEDDRLSEQVDTLRRIVSGGNKVAEKDFVCLTEMLMRQMLKLDSIEAEGEAKVQRKSEVHRVQSLVEIMDDLKVQNSNPISNSNNAARVREKFESEFGSSHTPLPMPSATKVTQDWEVFE